MSPYSSSPHGYQALQSPNSNDLQLPVHHALPPHAHHQPQSYPYDSQSAPHLHSHSPSPVPYPNGNTNGHHGEGSVPADRNGPPPAPASADGGGAHRDQRGARLRKACDSCSIRKVKVGVHSHPICQTEAHRVAGNSVTRAESLVELALLWISHAPSIDKANAVDLPIDTQRQSRKHVSSPHLVVLAACLLLPPPTTSPRLWFPSPQVLSSMQSRSAACQSSSCSSTISSPISIHCARSPTSPPSEVPSTLAKTSRTRSSSPSPRRWLASW